MNTYPKIQFIYVYSLYKGPVNPYPLPNDPKFVRLIWEPAKWVFLLKLYALLHVRHIDRMLVVDWLKPNLSKMAFVEPYELFFIEVLAYQNL